jgi:hypothetical protein
MNSLDLVHCPEDKTIMAEKRTLRVLASVIVEELSSANSSTNGTYQRDAMRPFEDSKEF